MIVYCICTDIDHAVYHAVPVPEHVVLEVSVVDELVDDAGVVLDAEGVQHRLRELVPQEVAVRGHVVGLDEGVVDHCTIHITLCLSACLCLY